MTGRWAAPQLDHTYNGHSMYKTRTTTPDILATSGVSLTQPGINWQAPLWFNVGYAIPIGDCWSASLLVHVCYRRSYAGTDSKQISDVFLDIFPATLDELSAWAWSNHDLKFTVKDRDGDNLLSTAYGGNDPDDTKWDADGDALSDWYEVTQRALPPTQGGVAYNPARADTDADGLRDDAEMLLGTDPARDDTDADQVADADEIAGYAFTYGPGLTTTIASNPLAADFDGDGMSDFTERQLYALKPDDYPFKPDVFNTNPLGTRVRLSAANYAQPGAVLHLTETVTSTLSTLVTGTLGTAGPAIVSGLPPTATFGVTPDTPFTQTSTLRVQAGIPSQPLRVVAQACGTLAAPLAYFPFDEPAGATVFHNQLSNRYNAICVDEQGMHCPVAGQPPAAGKSGYSVYFNNTGQLRQYLGIADQLNFDDGRPFSIAAWINPQRDGNDHATIIGERPTYTTVQYGLVYGLREGPPFGVGGLRAINLDGQSLDYDAYPPFDLPHTWSPIAMVFDGDSFSMYHWGFLVGRVPSMPAPKARLANLTVGGHAADWRDVYAGYVGYIDDLYLFDRALSPSEVAALAGRSTPLQPDAAACDLVSTSSAAVLIDGDAPTSTLASFSAGQFLNTTGTLIIGGSAADPTSFVSQVEVWINQGTPTLATGTASWSYPLDTSGLPDGMYTLHTRATDAVGNVEPQNLGVWFFKDTTPPMVYHLTPPPLQSATDPSGAWLARLSGMALDPSFSHPFRSASGVASVRVLLTGEAGLSGMGWQTATLSNVGDDERAWTLDYVLPSYDNRRQTRLYPTGRLTATIVASDNAGNVAAPSVLAFAYDATPPSADLRHTGPSSTTITTTVALSGVATDTGSVASGVASVEVGFIRGDVLSVMNSAEALWRLDEGAGKQVFEDGSGRGRTGRCAAPVCPTAGVPGKIDGAVDVRHGAMTADNLRALAITGSVSVAAWISLSQYLDNAPFVSQWDTRGQTGTLFLGLQNGLTFALRDDNGRAHQVNAPSFPPMYQNWVHVVAVWNAESRAALLYVDGAYAAGATTGDFGALAGNDLPLAIGSFPGAIDEVMIYPYALSDQQVNALFSRGAIVWARATLAQQGAVTTAWTYTVPWDIPGNLYQIDVRSIDAAGNRDERRSEWNQWHGEIDTQAPYLWVFQDPMMAFTRAQCYAQDYNLDLSTYECAYAGPVQERDKRYYHQVSDWYDAVISDTTRLFSIEQNVYWRSRVHVTARACDRHGRCSTSVLAPGNAPDNASLMSLVITPANGTVLASTNPVSAFVEAEAAGGLRAITLTVDGAPYAAGAWPSGVVTRTTWAVDWAPPRDGVYRLASIAEDWAGAVQTAAFTTTLYVDTQPPAIDITPTVLTTAHQLPYTGVNLTGPVTDAGGIAEAAVSIDGGPWQAASVADGAWRHAWQLDNTEDGIAHRVVARATDLAGRTVRVTRTVTVDIQPPVPVTITVFYTDSGGLLSPVAQGQTISDVPNPALLLTWSASSDAAGLSHYLVGAADATGSVALSALDPLAPRERILTTTEASAYMIQAAAQDANGNQSWSRFGPVYADTPFTPDYAPMAPYEDEAGQGWPAGVMYEGWRDNGCSQIGVDRTVSELAAVTSARNGEQRLHVTWDADGLRLSWRGADWDADGHLLVFLDTLNGQGTRLAHNPISGSRLVTVVLPAEVDYAVWISDTRSARLLRWDGVSWAPQGGLAMRVSVDEAGPATDVALPFSSIGVLDPATAPLSMIAFALERAGPMQVWSAMPPNNPRNSAALLNPGGAPAGAHLISLWHAYHWDNLASGQCPHQGRYLDVDLRARLSVTPAGVVSDTRIGVLYWAWPVSQGCAQPVLGDGQVVTYTFTIDNAGRAAAIQPRILLTASGSLALPGGERVSIPGSPVVHTQTLILPDIAPGGFATVNVAGLVDTTTSKALYSACLQANPADPAACQLLLDAMRHARLSARLVDRLQPEASIEILSADHLADAEPPTSVAIVAPPDQRDNPPAMASAVAAPAQAKSALALPPIYFRPGLVSLQGTALDPAGVPQAQVELLNPRGDTSDSACANPTPNSGAWSCAIPIPDAGTADRYFARVLVTDTFGHRSSWSPWRVLIADDQPPVASLSPNSQRVLTSVVFGPVMPIISGTLADEAVARQVDLCVSTADARGPFVYFLPFVMTAGAPAASVAAVPNAAACIAVAVVPGNAPNGAWSYRLPWPGAIDGGYQTLELIGRDAAGNSSAGVRYGYRVDTVAPRLAVTDAVTRVSLAAYQAAPFPLLRGTASDGSRAVFVTLRDTGPEGVRIEALTAPQGTWAYLPPATDLAKGSHLLWVNASDAAGNTAWRGLYTVVVEE
jgi:hypothetical protein